MSARSKRLQKTISIAIVVAIAAILGGEIVVDLEDRDPGPLAREAPGDGAPDPVAGSGHQGSSVGIAHCRLLLCVGARTDVSVVRCLASTSAARPRG